MTLLTLCTAAATTLGGTGSTGVPIPYSLRADDAVTAVLLGCFLLSAYILSRSRKFLLQLVKDFMLNRDRTSIFSTSTATDMRYLLLLIGQSCVLAGVCLLHCFNDLHPELVQHLPSIALLGLYIGACLSYLILKWMVYSLVGWVFFGGARTELWIESYSTLLYYLGFALFPFSLAVVYFDTSLQTTVYFAILLAVCFKILVFYKWLRLFCSNLHGGFLLILYFCALEIMPCLLMYQGLMQLNDYLIIKF